MNLCLINHSFRYEIEKLIRIFLPFEKIVVFDKAELSDFCAVTEIADEKGELFAKSKLYINDKVYSKILHIDLSEEDILREQELKLAQSLFCCFTDATDYSPQWGILTGVRPAKLFGRFAEQMGIEKASEYFRESFKVNDKKVSLCKETNLGEKNIISLSAPESFSLYISVPFCPTRCSYCSFVSHSVEKAKTLIPEYIELLCKEIEYTGEIAKKNKLRLETVYIGGGTPTSLSAEQLEKIMCAVSKSFDFTTLREYTVEAGRPDTVTEDKLNVIKRYGATRISINPQTMNDAVLENIGRRHTAKQTAQAFKLARKLGFDNINMDLIAGLPGDTVDSFEETVNKILELAPESVTVHSLSMKRSSTMTKKGELPEIEIGKIASLMVDFAHSKLSENGILPYYMYRQSKTVGNLENVGYSKKGFECLYNVYIMDETHTILACGASAVTKLREPNGNYIERIFNFKYPYEYIDRFEEIISRKDGIYEFYNKFSTRNQ